MKFMLNGAPTLGTMDGANVEIVEEVGIENAFIFGLSAEEVMKYEREGGYNPMDIYNNNQAVRRVLTQLIDGTYAPDTIIGKKHANSFPIISLAEDDMRTAIHTRTLHIIPDMNALQKSRPVLPIATLMV